MPTSAIIADPRRAASASCSHCGSSQIRRLGLGTEKLEVEIQNRFPQACVERMDRDTTRRKGAIIQLLRRLRERKIDILVGTQMVAKGHDYPHITLVGIVCADLSLSMPDFRAGERTFQLLAQVAGPRWPGKVSGAGDPADLQPATLQYRRRAQPGLRCLLPAGNQVSPDVGLPALFPHDSNPDPGERRPTDQWICQAAGATLQFLSADQKAHGGVDVLGPIEAPLPKIADYFRWQILLKSTRADAVHRFARNLLFSPQSPPNPAASASGSTLTLFF
jgi:primosomal protein N' (replication factor Y)